MKKVFATGRVTGWFTQNWKGRSPNFSWTNTAAAKPAQEYRTATDNNLAGSLYFPLNYGYVEGITAQDGEERCACVMGAIKPKSSATIPNTGIFVAQIVSCCPEHRGICYPINHGFVQGITAPDGRRTLRLRYMSNQTQIVSYNTEHIDIRCTNRQLLSLTQRYLLPDKSRLCSRHNRTEMICQTYKHATRKNVAPALWEQSNPNRQLQYRTQRFSLF